MFLRVTLLDVADLLCWPSSVHAFPLPLSTGDVPPESLTDADPLSWFIGVKFLPE